MLTPRNHPLKLLLYFEWGLLVFACLAELPPSFPRENRHYSAGSGLRQAHRTLPHHPGSSDEDHQVIQPSSKQVIFGKVGNFHQSHELTSFEVLVAMNGNDQN